MKKIFNKESLIKYIIYFTIVSFAGYFIELIFVYLSMDIIVDNRNWGPYFQIYGFATVFIAILYDILKEKYDIKPIPFFVAGIFITMGIEFLASVLIEITQGVEYWNYSYHKFNIDGRTSLLKGIEFSSMLCIFIYFIRPLLDKLARFKIIVIICTVLSIIIMLDSITATFRILH